MLDDMQLTDTHSHTVYSGHGEGTPAELVAAALDRGLSTLAITEHLPLPAALDPDGTFSMLPEQALRYRQEVDAARQAASAADVAADVAAAARHLEVICGTEVDWVDGGEAFILEQLGMSPSAGGAAKGHYQLILGSVHMLTGEDPSDPEAYWPLDYTLTIDGWHIRGPRYVWERYVGLWLDAVASEVPFDVMSHPDLPKKLGFAPDFDATGLWRQMAEAAAAADVMVELNTSGLYAPCAEVYPGPELLAEFRRAGVPCTISSDAHSPANVGRAHRQAVEAMLAAGYRHVTLPTSDGDRRQIPLA
jgi:histidinol-phosphatase (PHP family)